MSGDILGQATIEGNSDAHMSWGRALLPFELKESDTASESESEDEESHENESMRHYIVTSRNDIWKETDCSRLIAK
ncbi:hypothetical protein AMATHDRAFT_68298 [Amanita thiersii Skay4041]|uniref:Uncharacterized protein n=1 Tax=Amanita thiersii Skay4041 TaxID=703135 RepID=A0A2A9NCY2_9AGAR|nr:hypothetical protein AMATHDRAFT_68298 [Amanita thiersii Skay4041]